MELTPEEKDQLREDMIKVTEVYILRSERYATDMDRILIKWWGKLRDAAQ